jgi:hypothetical protein
VHKSNGATSAKRSSARLWAPHPRCHFDVEDVYVVIARNRGWQRPAAIMGWLYNAIGSIPGGEAETGNQVHPNFPGTARPL